MLILLPVGLLFSSAFALVLIPKLRPNFSSHWLVAVGGAFLAWISLVMLEFNLPQSLVLSVWFPSDLLIASPELILDETSWSFALAISTLGLSTILVNVRRSASGGSLDWAYALILVGLGIFASFSANWLTLAINWTLIDLVVRLMRWLHNKNEESRQKVLVGFSGNLIAVIIFLAGLLIGNSGQMGDLDFTPHSSLGIFLVVLSIGIRLGISIIENEIITFDNSNWGLQPLFLFVPSAATMALVARISLVEQFQTQLPYVAAISLAAVFYGAVRWTRSINASTGTSYWIFSIGFLALAAALLNYPNIALAWGLVLIYVGGFFFLATQNSRRTVPLAALALFGFSTLPYSPTNASQEILSPLSILIVFPLILIHALLIFGFVRHFYRVEKKVIGVERWVKAISFLGIAWLPLTHILLSQKVLLVGFSRIGTGPWWPAAAGIGVAMMLMLLSWREIGIPETLLSVIDSVFSLRWIFRIIEWAARGTKRMIELITTVLEGEGGMLWALLLVALLASLLVQIQASG